MALSGSDLVSEVEKLGTSAKGYSETLDAGTGPNYFDCSGLIQKALTDLGVKGAPRTSEQQWAWVEKISANQLQPGDLVFAQFPGDNASPGHVGIYVGNGLVYSAQDQTLGIGYATLKSWGGNIVGYGQVPNASETGMTGDNSGSSGGSWLGFLSDPVSAASDMLKVVEFLINPLSWLRIIAGFAGFIFLGAGLFMMAKAA